MSTPGFARSAWWWVGAALGVALASGCSALLPKPAAAPLVYSLDDARNAGSATTPPAPRSAVSSAAAPTLVVSPTRAAPGFDGTHIVYVRTPHQLEHFAHSEWVDPPARMLAPLIVEAIEASGSFRAVGPAASGIAGTLRLDTELLRLQQEFGVVPSRVRFTLRAVLLDAATRRVISSQEFDETVMAQSDDPYGGVVAAHRAVQSVMAQLARFCTEGARLAP